MKNFNKELIDFINKGTSPFTSCLYLKNVLSENGYQELKENEEWKLDNDKYFVVRNDASIIAFNLPKKYKEQFSIIATHLDTPTFIIKPRAEFYEDNYLKLNVAPYGGILNYAFMDRPLSIAGRIITKQKNSYKKEIIDLKETVGVIPSVAIHQNDEANSNLDLNTHNDLIPLINQKKDYNLEKLIQDKLNIKDKITDYDLFLYNNEEPHIINDTFLLAPRIDNLTCTFSAYKAFLNNLGEAINILAVFNSEEIGSNTYEGADSNFLIDTLKKLCGILKIDLTIALNNSLIISADNTHALHPNHPEVGDHTNKPALNEGILITKEINGTTSAISATVFKDILEKHKLPYSYYTSRNDFATGSTQAGVSLKHLSINSLDVALGMVAMHSAMELIGLKDIYDLYQAFKYFYQTKYMFKDNQIIIEEIK